MTLHFDSLFRFICRRWNVFNRFAWNQFELTFVASREHSFLYRLLYVRVYCILLRQNGFAGTIVNDFDDNFSNPLTRRRIELSRIELLFSCVIKCPIRLADRGRKCRRVELNQTRITKAHNKRHKIVTQKRFTIRRDLTHHETEEVVIQRCKRNSG